MKTVRRYSYRPRSRSFTIPPLLTIDKHLIVVATILFACDIAALTVMSVVR